MHSATMQAKVRIVFCRNCGKPIHLSASLAQRELATRNDEPASKFNSRVFSSRCRNCHVEGIYSLDDITEGASGATG
jgi:hypothetical protein